MHVLDLYERAILQPLRAFPFRRQLFIVICLGLWLEVLMPYLEGAFMLHKEGGGCLEMGLLMVLRNPTGRIHRATINAVIPAMVHLMIEFKTLIPLILLVLTPNASIHIVDI